MKLHLQTSMDMLESSRKKVIDKILDIDQTMDNPKMEDIERIGNCKYCEKKDDGPTCIHCELDELFQVSKPPSETEVVLGVIRNHCKTYLDREAKLAATKHLHTLEMMRKEYAHARALARAQAQLLRAYDEIKMATMRLQLK